MFFIFVREHLLGKLEVGKVIPQRNGLRKQVMEVNEESLEFGSEEAKGKRGREEEGEVERTGKAPRASERGSANSCFLISVSSFANSLKSKPFSLFSPLPHHKKNYYINGPYYN